MSQWKKDWSSSKKTTRELKLDNKDDSHDDIQFIKQRMRKIQKRNNPKNIPVFENIYEHPQPSIIEGMEGKDLETTSNTAGEAITDTSNTTGSGIVTGANKVGTGAKKTIKDANDSEIGQSVRNKVTDATNTIGKRWVKAMDEKNFTNPISDLKNQLSTNLDNLSNLQDLANIGSSLKGLNTTGFASTADNMKDAFKIDKKGIDKVMNEVSGSMKSLSTVFSRIFALLAQHINQAKIYMSLYILQINEYIDVTLTRTANALTQNTATEKEIQIFKDQAQQFTTMMLVWYFVYNWYYIIFFIEEGDGILYKFDTNKLKQYNTYFYGAFGPACRVIEKFNEWILKCRLLKTKAGLPEPILMILMFIIFFILVSNNFQSSLITDFFNAMRGKFSTSILSIIVIMIVIYYSLAWFLGSKTEGNIEMASLEEFRGSIFSICFYLVIFFVCLLCYIMWTVTVNIPLAMFFISAYLIIYTFCGVVFYEGINAGMIITGITNSIDIIEPDLTKEGCTPEDVRIGSWLWWKGLIPRFIQFLKEIVNFCSINMFELLIFFLLLGGIGLYKKEWSSAIEGKVGLGNTDGGLMSPNGIKNIFKHLFVWLVIINVLLLFLLSSFLYNKFKIMQSLKESTSGLSKSASADKTARELLSATNPTMASAISRGSSGLNNKAINRMNELKKGTEKPEQEPEQVVEKQVQETEKTEQVVEKPEQVVEKPKQEPEQVVEK